MNKNDFYIGWMSNAPPTYFKFVTKYLFALIVLTISLGAVLALSQKQFATGTFEFGKLTEVKGIYFSQPIPSLKIVNGKDIWGNPSYITCPLVGYGKHGAAGIIADIEKEKGTITIIVEKRKSSDTSDVDSKDMVVVMVKDNGAGIDKQILPNLFTKFASKSFQGTGLGLYICKSIVDSHGGKIWAKNNENGKGATFSFSLPLDN